MKEIYFIDTSVLCNLLRVPGRDQDWERIAEDFKELQDLEVQFILPITSVIETGTTSHNCQPAMHAGKSRGSLRLSCCR